MCYLCIFYLQVALCWSISVIITLCSSLHNPVLYLFPALCSTFVLLLDLSAHSLTWLPDQWWHTRMRGCTPVRLNGQWTGMAKIASHVLIIGKTRLALFSLEVPPKFSSVGCLRGSGVFPTEPGSDKLQPALNETGGLQEVAWRNHWAAASRNLFGHGS